MCPSQGLVPERKTGPSVGPDERRHGSRRVPLPQAEQAFFDASEAMLITDAAQRILAVNPALEALVGLDEATLRGRSPEAFVAPQQGASQCLADWQLLLQEEQGRLEMLLHDARGASRPALFSFRRVRDAAGAVSHHVVTLAALDRALSEPSRRASREAYFDALTGLPNLRLVTQLLQDAIAHAQGGGETLAVCCLDIDHFKRLNDQLGELAGDRLLASFARRVSHLLAGDEVLARIGGDEFVLLLHRQPDEAFLERLLTAIRQPLLLDDQSLRLTASIGVTLYPDDEQEGDVLLRHATQAMYRAKQRGRNTYHRFDPGHDRQLQVRQAQRERFARAIDNDELCLYYQPQVDMGSGRVTGLEALVRWQHPERGLLAPGEFLPVVEGTPLAASLGEWVIRRALSQLSAWQEAGIELPVSVNISPVHLLQADFVARLEQLLERYPEVLPGRLKLEVLESAAMHDIQAALEAIHRCKALGIATAIDDFGTGFSSLTYLRQLPVDLIKIDQSFVRDMLVDANDMAIVESVIYMAKRFGRPMLAEGVETLEHARALVALGCHQAQGYGIARPMPPEQLPTWLATWPGRGEWQRLG